MEHKSNKVCAHCSLRELKSSMENVHFRLDVLTCSI